VMSANWKMDNQNIFSITGLADGAGGVDSLGVGIGSSTPNAFFTVDAGGTATTVMNFTKACINLKADDGSIQSTFMGSAGDWVIEQKKCIE